MVAPVILSWWAGAVDLTLQYVRESLLRMSNPKPHQNLMFCQCPLVLTFAKEPAAKVVRMLEPDTSARMLSQKGGLAYMDRPAGGDEVLKEIGVVKRANSE
jgi:hypothetical protein